jgi:hypothetical protein
MNPCFACLLIASSLLSISSTSAKTPLPAVDDPIAKTIKAFKEIGLTPVANPLPLLRQRVWFSPGAKTIAIPRHDPNGQWSMLINGVPVGPFQGISNDREEAVWSDDGSTLGYIVWKSVGARNEKTLMLNDKEIARYETLGLITLSYDGKRYAYVAEANGAAGQLHLNDKDYGPFSVVSDIALSPDNSTAIWTAEEYPRKEGRNRGGFDVYVNGQKYPAGFRWTGRNWPYPGMTSLVISPNSKRWAVRGQLFGPHDREHGGIGGYAVMTDGKMGLSCRDVVYGTLQFTADSKDVLYAATPQTDGHYSVFRNEIRGEKWNYIRPNSLKLLRGGKSVAFTGYEGPPDRFFSAEDPIPGRPSWSPGTPCLVIDDKVVVPGCIDWAVSDNGQHFLAAKLETIKPLDRPSASQLIFDGNKIAELPEFPYDLQLQFSPNGKHWLGVLKDRNNLNPQLFIDGKILNWSPRMDVLYSAIGDSGEVTLLAQSEDLVWKVSSSPPATSHP